MTRKPGLIFEVEAAEFPIKVTISVKDLEANQSFVADTVLLTGGVPSGTVPVTLRTSGDTKIYSIAKPKKPNVDLLSVINAFFRDGAPSTSRYIVDIEATGGGSSKTSMRPPATNPAAAFLTFKIVEGDAS